MLSAKNLGEMFKLKAIGKSFRKITISILNPEEHQCLWVLKQKSIVYAPFSCFIVQCIYLIMLLSMNKISSSSLSSCSQINILMKNNFQLG